MGASAQRSSTLTARACTRFLPRRASTSVRVSSPRRRDGEEERLVRYAPPHLRDLIIAALETGCRRGELLSLRWSDIKWSANIILLLADVTKPHHARDVPMSRRLRAVLDMRRYAPDGTRHGPDQYVFGNGVGEPVKSVRTAWENTCRRANIEDLHFHDLRREFGSRLRETPGMSDHEVRDWLGHANITTTSRYLSTTRVGLQQAVHKFEEARNIRTKFAQTDSVVPNGQPESADTKALKPLDYSG